MNAFKIQRAIKEREEKNRSEIGLNAEWGVSVHSEMVVEAFIC